MIDATGRIGAALLCAAALTAPLRAQPVGTAFTYQGRLADGGTPATGPFDLRFVLYDAAAGGSQVGPTLVRDDVALAAGLFTVTLDFGAAAFGTTARFIEVGVRPGASTGAFTVVGPRQTLSPSPFSIRSQASSSADSLSAACVGCVSDANIASISGSKVSGLIPVASVPAGSPHYIHNSGLVQGGDFNIDGDGVAEVFSARSQFNIGSERVLGVVAGSASTFAGIHAGQASTGTANSFFGHDAGAGPANSGSGNSFFGERAGALNTTGAGNSFFGSPAGANNTSGGANSFFGSSAGQSNTTGGSNSYFGVQAGFANTAGNDNTFVGRGAGAANATSGNSFFGAFAGTSNVSGFRNSFFGKDAGAANTSANDNTFFGWGAGRATTFANGNSFFGSSAGASNTSGGSNTFLGGYAGRLNTTGERNTFVGTDVGTAHTTGWSNTFIGYFAGFSSTGSDNTALGAGADVGASLTHATAIGAEASVSSNNTIALGRSDGSDRVLVYGLLDMETLGVAGGAPVCRNASGHLAACSSSLRYKTNVEAFAGGLNVVRRLRPITFDWKDGGRRDLGFAAEEVEQVEPLLATYADDGAIEGVKYGQVTTVLVNAVKEQQAQIEAQQLQIDALKRLVCRLSPEAGCQ